MRLLSIIVCASAATVACKSEPPRRSTPPPMSKGTAVTTPTRTKKDEGDLVRYEARFDIDRLAGSKRLQACTLHLDDGRVLITAYQPVKEQIPFVDRRVVVRGRHYQNDPHVQQVDADHFGIVSIELAPGQSAGPAELPQPPLVKDARVAGERAGRWATLVGKLGQGRPRPDDEMWWDADLTLGDGAKVRCMVFGSSFRTQWQPLVNQRVSITCQIHRTKEGFEVSGRTAICAGEVSGCGMAAK